MTAFSSADGLFQLNPNARAVLRPVGGRLPILFIDDVFANPARLRESALGLPFHEPPHPFHYPGKIAEPDGADPSLKLFLRKILDLVNQQYLPRIPVILENGRPITAFSRVETDFAIVDVHPNDVESGQRKPHVDPVPIFGLVYLNTTERGGTLFFSSTGRSAGKERSGYFVEADSEYAFVGKIEGRFNRLAVYPGFVPHSGEIAGDWITTDERFSEPRLTQRLTFFSGPLGPQLR
jgi:Family of unknown function (DUF6445)